MAIGWNASAANSQLNVYRGTTYTGVTAYMKLHTGDPGAAGTANASGLTTRNAVTWNAASSESMTLSSIATYTMNTTETIRRQRPLVRSTISGFWSFNSPL